LLRCHGDDYSSVGDVDVSARLTSREDRLWESRVTADPSTFTFVQHGEPVHIRYAGASEVQVNVGATISDTDVIFRHSVRGHVIATLVAQEQISAFQHHRAKQASA